MTIPKPDPNTHLETRMTDQTETDFDGCRRACRLAGAPTLVSGECEHAPAPEPTVSMSKVFTDTDGYPSIGYDQYTVDQLAELLDPILGSEAMRARKGSVDLAHLAAHAIVHRNDEPADAAAVLAPATDRRCGSAQPHPPHQWMWQRRALQCPGLTATDAPTAPNECLTCGADKGPNFVQCRGCVLAEIRADVLPATVDRDFWQHQYNAEHARHVAVVGALVADRAAVLREAIEVARREGLRLEAEQGVKVARGARSVAYLLRKLLMQLDLGDTRWDVPDARPGTTDYTLQQRHAREAQQDEPPCCSDPTCACVQVNAAGRCECAQWDDAPVRGAQQDLTQDGPRHIGGNAENCAACEGTNPPYPFICPGPDGAVGAGQPETDEEARS